MVDPGKAEIPVQNVDFKMADPRNESSRCELAMSSIDSISITFPMPTDSLLSTSFLVNGLAFQDEAAAQHALATIADQIASNEHLSAFRMTGKAPRLPISPFVEQRHRLTLLRLTPSLLPAPN